MARGQKLRRHLSLVALFTHTRTDRKALQPKPVIRRRLNKHLSASHRARRRCHVDHTSTHTESVSLVIFVSDTPGFREQLGSIDDKSIRSERWTRFVNTNIMCIRRAPLWNSSGTSKRRTTITPVLRYNVLYIYI
jgi:hypothetical protein